MAALLAAVALGLMAYVPGRFLLRLLVPVRVQLSSGRLILELLLGNIATGLAAFLLAELGLFSLPGVLAILVAITLIAAGVRREAGMTPYARVDLFGLALGVAALAWVMPPLDTFLYGYDSTVYVSGGLSLARHGSIPFADPTLAEIPKELRQDLFPTFGREPGQPPFLRVAGGLLLPSLEDLRVLPALHHLLSVWVALAYDIGGDEALTAPAAYFAALSLWALASFAFGLAGWRVAAVACVLLFMSPAQYWYSRFMMPEVPSQYFLWAALVAAGASAEPGAGLLGVAAGLGLGLAGLMRIDGLGHVVAALALWKTIAPARSWPAARGFAPAFAAVAVWAMAHQILFPTHYYAELADLVRIARQRMGVWWPALAAPATPIATPTPFAALATGAAWAAASRLRGAAVRLGALVLFLGYLATTLVSTRADPAAALGWLVLYAGWPALIAGGLGCVLWVVRSALPSQRFALVLALTVFVQLFVDARVTPAPLWAIRRFVPIALPALLIAAALLLDSLARRRHWVVVIGLIVLLVGTAPRSVLTYRGDAFQNATTTLRAVAAQVPAGAVLVYDPAFALDTQMHVALWGLADAPAYLLGAQMREPLLALRGALPNRPVYWLGGANKAAAAAMAPIADAVASYRFAIGTRRLNWYDSRDEIGIRDVTVRLYRLHPAPETGERPDTRETGALH